MDKLHYFADSISLLSLPEKFTYPFHYIPHPLCVAAAGEVGRYLEAKGEWQEELRKGKMFGVLIVRTGGGKVGYLAAFSGILAGKNQHAYFVPPVYDVQEPDGFSGSKRSRYRESTGGSRNCRRRSDIRIASDGWLTRRSLPDRFWTRCAAG